MSAPARRALLLLALSLLAGVGAAASAGAQGRPAGGGALPIAAPPAFSSLQQTVAAERPAPQPPRLKVVFAAMPRADPAAAPGKPQIYSMNEDGSDLRQLTFDESVASDWPVWAMGGRKILYTVEAPPGREEENGIYLMNADGTGAERLLATRGLVAQPKLSPDGRSVIFKASWEPFPVVAIYRLDLETMRIHNLTAVGTPELGLDTDARWSPDGREIILAAGPVRDGIISEPQLFLIDADGGSRRQLTADRFWYTDPALSPDGRLIAASTYRGEAWPFPPERRGQFPLPLDWHLVVQDRASGAQRLLTRGAFCALRSPLEPPCAPDEGPSWIPVWTPDGGRIAFLSVRRSDLAGIYLIDLDGTSPRVIAELPGWIVIWHDWVEATDGLAAADAPVPRSNPDPSRVLVSALVHPTSLDGAGNVWFALDDEAPAAPSLRLSAASPAPWRAEEIPWPHAEVAPNAVRWTPDRRAILLTAPAALAGGAPPARPDASVVPRPRPPAQPDDGPPAALLQVFLAAADGAWVRQLTTAWTYDPLDAPPEGDPRANVEPDASPDGRFVVFANVSSTLPDAWILRLDLATGEVMNLTSVTCGLAVCVDRSPRYSPDGARIAFATLAGGRMQIAVMDAEGANVRRLTDDDADHRAPVWSPDGTRLAYTRIPGADGAGTAPSPERAAREGEPALPWELMVLDLATGAERALTSGTGSPVPEPVWAPDGSEIAFIAMAPSGRPDIYVVPVEGGEPRPLLVSTTAWELSIDWR